MSADRPDHGFFFVRKQITARFRLCILILSRRTSDNHQRGITHLCRTCRCFIVQRHFLLGPGFLPPSLPFVKRMFRTPRFVYTGQFFIYPNGSFRTERIQNSGHITGIHQTARTGAAFIICKLYSSEYRYGFPFSYRQRIVFILQQYTALRCRLSRQPFIFFHIQIIFPHGSLLFFSYSSIIHKKSVR